MSFTNLAETKAERVENLSAFSGIKILHIRNQIKEMLSLIGRHDIFDQYTKHDIKHIDEMLKLTEWVIPPETREIMTDAEWLMLVLGVYFHDFGMLVTKKEYDGRSTNNQYQIFKETLFSDKTGMDYGRNVSEMGNDSEKFLYQEYVRTNHAERIHEWIMGEQSIDNADCSQAIGVINSMLSCLSDQFRRDLAMICKSHHEDDLDNFGKYKYNVRYGSGSDAIVNLHYVAVILRTIDLLHITSDRVPSVLYKIIEPNNPKSVKEWQKQMAVKSVHAKDKRNHEGNIDPSIPKDTIGVTAYFSGYEQADAYFGLMSYLKYAKQQIKYSHKKVQEFMKAHATEKYQFPWKDIDDSEEIETHGFKKISCTSN